MCSSREGKNQCSVKLFNTKITVVQGKFSDVSAIVYLNASADPLEQLLFKEAKSALTPIKKQAPATTAADKTAADKVASDKAAADKSGDKVAADKVAADKAAADKVIATKEEVKEVVLVANKFTEYVLANNVFKDTGVIVNYKLDAELTNEKLSVVLESFFDYTNTTAYTVVGIPEDLFNQIKVQSPAAFARQSLSSVTHWIQSNQEKGVKLIEIKFAVEKEELYKEFKLQVDQSQKDEDEKVKKNEETKKQNEIDNKKKEDEKKKSDEETKKKEDEKKKTDELAKKEDDKKKVVE